MPVFVQILRYEKLDIYIFITGSWIYGLNLSCYPTFFVDRQFPLVLVFYRCDYNRGFKT